MNNVLIGVIKNEEKIYIQNVEKKFSALKELNNSLNHTDLLSSEFEQVKQSIKKDLKETEELIEKWWLDMCIKYDWDKKDINQYTLYFDSNEVCKTLN